MVSGIFLTFVLFGLASSAEIRPLYIVGDMANTIADVKEFIDEGANAIEADLNFDSSTQLVTEFSNGVPCGCFRLCHKKEDATTYLKYMRDLSTPGHPHFKPTFAALLWIDLKLKGGHNYYAAGSNFARILYHNIYIVDTKLKIVFELVEMKHWPFVDAIVSELTRVQRPDLLRKLGISITGSGNYSPFLEKLRDPKYKELGRYLGDGLTNCFEHLYDTKHIKTALAIRDAQSYGVSKVSRWTIDATSVIRNALWMGVDLILTNKPRNARTVLAEKEFGHKYRPATLYDDPFKTVIGEHGHRYGCDKGIFGSVYYCWKDKTVGGKWCWTNTVCSINPAVCNQNIPCA